MNVQFSNTSNTSYFKNIWNLSVICVGFLSPSQTPAPQPLNRPLHLVSLFFICSTHNPAPHPPFSPSNGKEDEKTTTTQQQPLLPVKLLVAPLTPLTGESKAIKMTRRQIVCDTSKGLEKAGKLSSATSSSTLRRGREEEKKTQSRQARTAWSTQAPRDSCALLSASPQTQTQTRPPWLHVQWLHHSRSRAQRG